MNEIERKILNLLRDDFNVAASEIVETLPVYGIKGRTEGQGWLGNAFKNVDRYFILAENKAIYSLDMHNGKFAALGQQGDRDLAILLALQKAKEAGLVTPGTEVRILMLPHVHRAALWLHGDDGTDKFIPYQSGVNRPQAFAVDPNFLDTVSKEAEERRKIYEKHGPTLGG